MKPFFRLHEAMVKPPAIRKRHWKTTGKGRGHGTRDKALSQICKALLGAVAITLTLGAVQFASGHVSEQPGHIVNRAGKTGRLADLKPFAVPTKTVSLRLNDLADTSVLLRFPRCCGIRAVSRHSPASRWSARSRRSQGSCRPAAVSPDRLNPHSTAV